MKRSRVHRAAAHHASSCSSATSCKKRRDEPPKALAVADMERCFKAPAHRFVLETGLAGRRMIRFLQPEWFWAFALLPLVMLWRGRRGPVAAIEYSDVSLRATSPAAPAAASAIVWLLPILAAPHDRRVGPPAAATAAPKSPPTASTSCWGSTSPARCRRSISHRRPPRQPHRVVKSVVSKFIDERPNDRIGLIAFAASPYLVSPLTLDHDWLQQNLERVNVGGRRRHRHRLGHRRRVNRLRTTTAKSKVVILLTDGVNNSGKISPSPPPKRPSPGRQGLHHRRRRARQGPHSRAGRSRQYAHHHGDVDVDEKTLQAMANETGGSSIAPPTPTRCRRSTNRSTATRHRRRPSRNSSTYDELYPWTLFPRWACWHSGFCCSKRVSQVTVRFTDPLWLLAAFWRLRPAHLDVASRTTCVNTRRSRASWPRICASNLPARCPGAPLPAARPVPRLRRLCLFARSPGPQLGYHWEQISRRGNEVVFAIDTSRSMLTPDVKPNRLTRQSSRSMTWPGNWTATGSASWHSPAALFSSVR
jgi:Ca-activated chloride channel family protein